ncbi:ABC transporter permease [uncultured Tenacibaculum sp.]|uniref:ABC transporter permease n=1 Tax=uncultured Tenacibaculum sp. TaxID=174713 RepID=UPI0026343A7D|nr:ABC transporter permease [uncultured Tenacibaculum sp.]
MNVWKISLQNIKSKPLYTFLSVFTLALSVALLLGIQQLKSSFEHQIENNLAGIDLVVGAKGSPLQLVLASVLHIDNPTGNISYKEAKKIGKNPMIKTAVPISYGDNYKGYKIVGTTDDFLKLYNAELEKGTTTKKSLEVVIGATIVEKLKLSIGDTFLSSHGLVENEIDVHDDKFTVVGILKPTYQVIDRLIITNLESIWDVHDHEETHADENHEKHTNFVEVSHTNHQEEDHNQNDHDEHQETEHKDHKHKSSEEDKEITSLLISFKNPVALLTMPRKINESTNMQAALPKYELDKLYNYTGIGFKTINWIAYLILIISGMIIFVSLYKMVKERSFDLALLRTYGASNFQLVKMMIYEGFLVVISAFIIGVLLVKIVLKFAFNLDQSGYQGILKTLSFGDIFSIGIVIVSFVLVAIGLSIYPIVTMNVSKILSNEK